MTRHADHPLAAAGPRNASNGVRCTDDAGLLAATTAATKRTTIKHSTSENVAHSQVAYTGIGQLSAMKYGHEVIP
jgi:hypothetical protein